MTSKSLWRSWLANLIVTLITVPLSIAYLDRPIADFTFSHINKTGIYRALLWFILPLGPMVVLAFTILLAGGLLVLSSGELPRRLREMSVPTIAVVMGIGAETMLKDIFGRSDIWPTYIKHDVFAFDFFDPRDGWRSFPSGTAIGLFALVGVLLVRKSRWSTAALAASLVICTLVTLVPFHWLSDMIAGIFVGLTIGYATASVLSAPPR